MNQNILKLMEFVYNVNETGNDSFFDYAGHVKWIQVRFFKGQWTDKKKELLELSNLTTENLTDDRLAGIISEVRLKLYGVECPTCNGTKVIDYKEEGIKECYKCKGSGKVMEDIRQQDLDYEAKQIAAEDKDYEL